MVGADFQVLHPPDQCQCGARRPRWCQSLGRLRVPFGNQQSHACDIWMCPKIGGAPNQPELDQFSVETHGFGVPPF